MEREETNFVCDACGALTSGDPSGHGEFMMVRNGKFEVEHPPLCGSCALAIGVTALTHLHDHEEDS